MRLNVHLISPIYHPMKLSNKTIYGIRALFDLAYFGAEGPVQSRHIAQRAAIPSRFLEQIFQDLKRAGLVDSKRGPKGGYTLTKPPERISLACVLKALDDMPSHVILDPEAQPTSTLALIDEVCKEALSRTSVLFETITLADMVRRGQSCGVERPGYEGFNYVI